MIIDVYKYLFIGSRKDIDRFFARAQKVGLAEFISPNGKLGKEVPKAVEDIASAIRILRKQPKKEEFFVSEEKDPKEIIDKIIGLKRRIENLHEDRKYLETEISRISPFGNFTVEDVRAIEAHSKKRMQFFCMKETLREKVTLPEELIYISTEYDMNYFISLSSEYVSMSGLIEIHIERSLVDLKHKLHVVKETIHNSEQSLKEMAGFLPYLHEKLLENLDHFELSSSKKHVMNPLDDSLFAVESWIPKDEQEKILPLLEGLAVHAEQVAIEKKDAVPTCMRNKGANMMGEDLVHIYDTPATDDKDPSAWVLWAFTIFFAVIISDAGYGMVYLLGALFLRYKFYKNAKAFGKRFIKLFTLLSVACVIWGVLSGSYFGIKVSPKNPVTSVSFIDYLGRKKAQFHIDKQDKTYQEIVKEFPNLKNVKNAKEFFLEGKIEKEGITSYVIMEEFHDNIFLEIALMLGIIHISLSLLRYLRQNWSGVGWVAFLVGGYLYFPSMLDAITMPHYLNLISPKASFAIGLQLLGGGFGVAVILGLIQHKLMGLEEIAKAIQIFADTLSYIRLYALALAAMILAATFNQLGMNAGYVGGFLIILVGHLTNIVLSTMGGVIHGLRLNYIEWYHYSFGGNGKLFKPLKTRIRKGE